VRVAIDLETTGLSPDQDAVIEIGAVKFAGAQTLDTFESFIATTAHLPYRIQRLTGIGPAQLKNAPPLAEIVPRLRAFLGDHPLVGHSVPFDAAFLRRAGLAHRNPLLDTYELASALLPNLPSYSLASVGTALGISSPTYHRALADAVLARDVFLALLARLEALDGTTLAALERLATPPDWTPGYLVRTTARAQREASGAHASFGGGTLGDQLAAKLGMDAAVLALSVAHNDGASRGQPPSESSADAPGAASAQAEPIAPTEAQGMIGRGVTSCLTEGGALAVEFESDPSGLRSCLAPALRWAHDHDGRLLVSTASSESMGRLTGHALPAAFAGAGIDPATLPVAELAEQEAYLCLHRWFGAAREARDGVLPRDIARGLAKLTVWAGQTRTGVRAEVALSGQEQVAWERARAGVDFVDSGDGCAYRRDGYCFVTRAADAARDARIVITTHAALVAHLAGDEGARLPDATRVIVLDAHLLEEEQRRAQSTALDRQELLAALANLAEVEAGGRRCGLLHMAAGRLGSSGGGAGAAQREQVWFAQVSKARKSAEAVFTALRAAIAEAQGDQGNGSRAAESPEQRTLRIDGTVRQLRTWDDAERAWKTLADRLSGLIRLARETARAIVAAKGNRATPASDGVATDLLAAARGLERCCRAGELVFGATGEDNRVQWLRIPYASAPGQQPGSSSRSGRRPTRGQRPDAQRDAEPAKPESVVADAVGIAPAQDESGEAPILHTAPIKIGTLLEPLWAPGRSLVLASTALAVAGDFAYTSGCLGLPESAQTLGPAMDRAEQTLLCLPTDVPEPNASQYQRQLDEALVTLAAGLGGRLVAIFPSHAALRTSAQGIRRALERHDILVLAQGQDGSARQLWHTFRTEPRVVLLGAGTFWEGGEQPDVPDQPPACVVVTRVPFPALSDPLLAARAETWSDPQNQFVVPHSALRVRQALGGLAWSHRQRNAIVLFDRRLQTRAYGPTILGTLPRCSQYQEEMGQIAERVVEWVAPLGTGG
jgi:DNA polymerase III epsilon subunit family exonuclease